MDFLLRNHVTKMLQGIYISFRAFLFLKSFSPPPPTLFNKKMEWAVLYPKYILFSLTLNSKLAQRCGRGLGGVNGVWLRTLSYFPLPTELSNS